MSDDGVSAALAYHALTTHGSPNRFVSSDARVVRDFRPMQPNRRPPQFKRYDRLPVVELPRDLDDVDAPATSVLSGGSGRALPVNVATLSRLLFYSAGVVRYTDETPWGRVWFRAAGSAGNLSPLEVYFIASDVEGLENGTYHYEPIEHALTRLHGAAADTSAVVVTGVPWRTAWKYRERGFRHLYWDCGTMLANLIAIGDACGLAPRVNLGFVDREATRFVGGDDVHEFALAVVTLDGSLAPSLELEASAHVPGRGYLADDPFVFPLIVDTQRAGDLPDRAAVGAWRADGGPTSETERIEPPGDSPSLEATIRRRGSTRAFDIDAVVPLESFDWAFRAATRPVAADFVPSGGTLLEHFIAVFGVEGIEPGSYRWTDDGAELVRDGDMRGPARHLCLDQALGGDGAYTAFHCADLKDVVARLGARGYRAANLEAGIVEGRLHLCAYALGLGATGLTFFDNEVSEFFSTNAKPLLVTAVGKPAYRSRMGGKPGSPRKF